jgi:hypothetical protein
MNKNLAKTREKRHSAGRQGAATIEFVFALPILLLLMVCLTWLGFSMLNQAEVNVAARHQAWQHRYENSNVDPFVFTTHPGYQQNEDFAKGESEKPVNVSRLFDSVSSPKATSSVLAGSWDYRDLQLDEIPNWRLYGKAIVNAKTGDLQKLSGGMDNFRQLVSSIGANLLKNQLNQLGGLSGAASKASASQQSSSTQQQQSRESEKRKYLDRKAVLDKELEELENIEKRQNGILNPTQTRKLFRLKSELSDIEIQLRELR